MFSAIRRYLRRRALKRAVDRISRIGAEAERLSPRRQFIGQIAAASGGWALVPASRVGDKPEHYRDTDGNRYQVFVFDGGATIKQGDHVELAPGSFAVKKASQEGAMGVAVGFLYANVIVKIDPAYKGLDF